MSEDLADRIEALDAKAGIVEARARKICERRGVNPDKIVDEYGPVLEWHVEAYHISAAVAEIIAALRLAETSSITVPPDGAPSALADRVETSAALDDVAGLVEPSDDERSQWPEATEAYVLGLEAVLTAQVQRLAELEAQLLSYDLIPEGDHAKLLSRIAELEAEDKEWMQLTIRENKRICELEDVVRLLANFDARNSIVHLRDIARAALKGGRDEA